MVTTATTSTTTTSITEPPGPRTIQIDYEDGVTTDTVQVEVELGSRVIIVVTADVEDDVVVPGYSVSADVGPSSAAIIEFDANVPGTFEVELEDANKVLVEIEVG